MNSKWKAYSNESEKDDEVTTIVVKTNWECAKLLKSVDITLIYYNEMKRLIMTMKHLVEKCVVENEYKNKIYKVYSNNQTSLKAVRSIKSNNDQTRLRRTQKNAKRYVHTTQIWSFDKYQSIKRFKVTKIQILRQRIFINCKCHSKPTKNRRYDDVDTHQNKKKWES